MTAFHKTLSESTVYHRYMQVLKLSRRIAHERLARMCFADIQHEIALVALIADESEIIGVGRLSRDPDHDVAELAIVITDKYQHTGLGTEFTRRLLDIAREHNIGTIRATTLADNLGMLRILQRFGFTLPKQPGETVREAILNLSQPG